jgi:hypothetical protein
VSLRWASARLVDVLLGVVDVLIRAETEHEVAVAPGPGRLVPGRRVVLQTLLHSPETTVSSQLNDET